MCADSAQSSVVITIVIIIFFLFLFVQLFCAGFEAVGVGGGGEFLAFEDAAAAECGFKNVTRMSMLFKKAAGMTPGAWRKQFRNQ